MKPKYIAFTVILAIAAGFVAVRSHSMRRGWGPDGGRMLEHGVAVLAWKLDLTAAQRDQVKSMIKADWPGVQPLLQQLGAEQKQMLAATQSGSFDESKVNAIANQQSQTIGQLIVAKERFLAQVYGSVLTPEQRTKADAMRQKLSQRIDQHLLKPPV